MIGGMEEVRFGEVLRKLDMLEDGTPYDACWAIYVRGSKQRVFDSFKEIIESMPLMVGLEGVSVSDSLGTDDRKYSVRVKGYVYGAKKLALLLHTCLEVG